MSVHEITDNNFQNEVLEEKKTVLIDFFADWCYPCKMMAPVVEEVSKEESIKVGKVNIDENQELAEKYGVESIPTIIVFKNGKEYKRQVGVTDRESLLNLLN
jgi:thioredoxin 1